MCETLLGLRPSSKFEHSTATQAVLTQLLQPVIRGYDPESTQVQEIQLAAPSSANFLSNHFEKCVATAQAFAHLRQTRRRYQQQVVLQELFPPFLKVDPAKT
ncbi:hypothetical protein MRX96_027550 [Rhipicephalus microplus]